jgi:hypothetical protein
MGLVCLSAASPSWLKWDAPPECPGVAHLEARLTEWMGRSLDPDIDLQVRASITWKDGAWEVSTHFVYRQQVGERQVRVDTCTEAVDFVALTVVLAVDPGFVGEEDHAASAELDSEARPLPDLVGEKGGGSADGSRAGDSSEESRSSPQGKSAAATPSAMSSSESNAAGETEGLDSDPDRSDYKWFGAISAMGAGGILPGFSMGPKGSLGMRTERFSVAVAVSYLLANAHDVGASNLVSSSLLSTHLEGCYLWGDRPAFGPCLGGQLGALSGREISASSSARGESGLWGAVTFGGKLVWHWSQVFGALITAELVLPLAAPHFVLESEREVFRPGPGFQGNVGLVFGF